MPATTETCSCPPKPAPGSVPTRRQLAQAAVTGAVLTGLLTAVAVAVTDELAIMATATALVAAIAAWFTVALGLAWRRASDPPAALAFEHDRFVHVAVAAVVLATLIAVVVTAAVGWNWSGLLTRWTLYTTAATVRQGSELLTGARAGAAWRAHRQARR